jgi:hypothetical protein
MYFLLFEAICYFSTASSRKAKEAASILAAPSIDSKGVTRATNAAQT